MDGDEMQQVARRLAAVLFADVVGYSRLMRQDEARTLAILRQLRDSLFEPIVVVHRGEVIKRLGDGWLVEFASVEDAVKCAMEVQRRLQNDDTIQLRIGVHLGDILHEDDDILGDGVNIAARLEQAAPEGGISISDVAWQSVSRAVVEEFVDAGRQQLKNIPDAVTMYVWHPSGGVATRPRSGGGIDKPSLAVLPFADLSPAGDQDYFADGVVEALTAALSPIRSFFVVARSSSFVFKGRIPSSQEVRDTLGVRYYLEGSVQRAGDRVRINVQLVETERGSSSWAEHYDGALADLFDLQDHITEQVAGALQPSIRRAEVERARRKRPQELDAYDFVMQGLPLVWSHEQSDNARALELLRRAIEIDPDYAMALALAAWCEGQRLVYNWAEDREATKDSLLMLARRGENLSEDDPLVLTALGAAQTFVRNIGEARALLERAVHLDPNSAWGWSRLGWLKCYLDLPSEAIDHFHRAIRLSPHDPMAFNGYFGLGAAYAVADDTPHAIEYYERGLRENPSAVWIYRDLAGQYAAAGRIDDARVGVRTLLAAYPDLTIGKIREAFVFSKPVMDRMAERLRLAGLPD